VKENKGKIKRRKFRVKDKLRRERKKEKKRGDTKRAALLHSHFPINTTQNLHHSQFSS
jgi:hypothetical protein